jgi:hypothetical protein
VSFVAPQDGFRPNRSLFNLSASAAVQAASKSKVPVVLNTEYLPQDRGLY